MDNSSIAHNGSPVEPPNIACEADCADDVRLPEAVDRHDALLLDVDGTLLELAESPEGVHCPPDLPDLLRKLVKHLGGAVAIVSGRRLASVDELLKPLRLPGAGVYGTELRLRPEGPIEAPDIPEIAALASDMRNLFIDDSRILVEDKKSSVAIHFRRAPERARECRELLAKRAPCPPLKIVEGHCVVEACPAVTDKGMALDRIMGVDPFRERRPIFVGDDRSDELAFKAAERRGGFGIKVGEGDTAARYRIRSVREVRSWLRLAVGANGID